MTPIATSRLKPTFLIVLALPWLPEPTHAIVTPATRMSVESSKYNLCRVAWQ